MNQDEAIISRFTDAPGTLYEVVEADQLPHAGHRGFSLAAVLYEDRLVVPGDHQYDSRYTPEPSAHPAVVLRQARYLMRQDAESALSGERQIRIALEEQRNAAWKELQDCKASDVKQEQEKKKLQTELQTMRDNYAAVVRSRESELAGKRKLEVDIAKIRVALGDLRMKEILAS